MILVFKASELMAVVTNGRSRCFASIPTSPCGLAPDAGSQPSTTANNQMSMRPSQKLGVEKNTIEPPEMEASSPLRRVLAAMAPKMTETTVENTRDQKASTRV